MPRVPFAFEFESEWPNGDSVTKQSPNYHSSDLDKVSQTAEWREVFQKHGSSHRQVISTCQGPSWSQALINIFASYLYINLGVEQNWKCLSWILLDKWYC